MYIIIIQTDAYCGTIVIPGVPIFVDVVFNNNNNKTPNIIHNKMRNVHIIILCQVGKYETTN